MRISFSVRAMGATFLTALVSNVDAAPTQFSGSYNFACDNAAIRLSIIGVDTGPVIPVYCGLPNDGSPGWDEYQSNLDSLEADFRADCLRLLPDSIAIDPNYNDVDGKPCEIYSLLHV